MKHSQEDDNTSVLWFCAIVAAITLLLALFLAPWQALPATFFSPPTSADRTADLLAQQQMAAAAWSMLALSVVSFAVGIATMVLLYLTFKETRRSALAAELAAESAQQSVTTSARLGEASIQAYLDASHLSMEFGRPDITVHLRVSNTGQTPGRGVNIEFDCLLMAAASDSPETYARCGFSPRRRHFLDPVAADDRQEVSFQLPAGELFTPQAIAAARSGSNLLLSITGRLSWRNVFQVRQEQPFHYQLYAKSNGYPYDDTWRLKRAPERVMDSDGEMRPSDA